MKLLAFDTSTDTLSLAVQHGDAVLCHTAAGGAQASRTLIPALQLLMAQAGLRWSELDAIVFGRGPGSFTGLRTACSVAQGLALGADVPVLPVDTLDTLADAARRGFAAELVAPPPLRICAALDARMGQWYARYYDFNSKLFSGYDGEMLISPLDLAAQPEWATPGATLLAGNVRPVLAQGVSGVLDAAGTPVLSTTPASATAPHTSPNTATQVGTHLPDSLQRAAYFDCLPTASALLRLAPDRLRAGMGLDAAQALPLYVRDKVASTSAERLAARA